MVTVKRRSKRPAGWRVRMLQLATAGGWALVLGGLLLLAGRGLADLPAVLVVGLVG
ncbi:MAG: hypothetical protein HY701_07710, partial [Gemmatimonadetes bacterium]|nr:hypothetical protein [Gemmatimonadota bacterium]